MSKNKKYVFLFLSFLLIFLLINLSEIVFYELKKINHIFLELKLIEIAVISISGFFLFLCLRLKRFGTLSDKILSYIKIFSSLLLLIFFSECQFYQLDHQFPQDVSIFFMTIGIFIVLALQQLSTLLLKLLFLSVSMVYLGGRYFMISNLHIPKMAILMLGLYLYYFLCNSFQKKQLKFDKIPAKSDKLLKNYIFKRIIKEEQDEGIAIFDKSKKLLFKNQKFLCIVKNNTNEIDYLSKFTLKLMSKSIKFKNDNSLKDEKNNNILSQTSTFADSIGLFLNLQMEYTFDKILDYIILSNSTQTFASSIQISNIQLTFQINNFEIFEAPKEPYQWKVVLEIFFKTGKVDFFYIKIQPTINIDDLFSQEKKIQNNKIFFVSHEMRTPLNCIVSMLQILKAFLVEDQENLVEEYITPAVISCNFLLYLVEDLLDMAQMNSEKFKIIDDEFNVHLLIQDILNLFIIQANTKSVEIIQNIAIDVPKIVTSDHRRIRQILINLIGNSMKFIKKNGTIHLDVFLSPECFRYIVFKVRDNGIGIKEEDQKKLFSAFGKIDSNESKKMNANGVGLGLMISNNLAINLNPKKSEGLKVESEFGFGTSFTFMIEDKTDCSNYVEIKEKSLNELHQQEIKETSNPQHKFLHEFKKIKMEELSDSIKKDSLYSLMRNNKDNDNFKRCISKTNFSLFMNKIENSFTSSLNSTYNKNLGKNLSPIMNRGNFILHQSNFGNSPKSKYSISDKKNKNNSLLSLNSFSDVFYKRNSESDYEKAIERLEVIQQKIKLKICQCPEILICDDNAFNIYSLKKQLENYNFRIDCANDGEEAICLVKEYYQYSNCCKGYNFIFMDIEMPGKNGYETSLEIKMFLHSLQINLDSPIIVCSAHKYELEPEKHKKYGIEEFSTKPIIKEKLVLLLAKYFK